MPKVSSEELSFIITPDGFLADYAVDMLSNEPNLSHHSQHWLNIFTQNPYHALYALGFAESQDWFSPSMRFLYRVATRFVVSTLQQPDMEFLRENAGLAVSDDEYKNLISACPFMTGSEYVNQIWLKTQFERLLAVFREEIAGWDGTVENYLTCHSQNLSLPRRIFFHLVENKYADMDTPFAFMATYSTENKQKSGLPQHYPLHYALTEYKQESQGLIALIRELEDASSVSPFVYELMSSGELFHPLKLFADEAYTFLKDIPKIEAAGVVCRVPNWWKKRSSTPSLHVKIGEKNSKELSAQMLVEMTPVFNVHNQELTLDEIKQLMSFADGLAFFKGKWVEVNQQRLTELLAAFDDINGRELSFFEALRQTATPHADGDIIGEVTRGEWLEQFLSNINQSISADKITVPNTVHVNLRHYQQSGYAWLNYMQDIGLGACLADDMGLGKTLQVIAFLEQQRIQYINKNKDLRVLVIVPTSLLGNWEKELQRFAPEMDFEILHGTAVRKLHIHLYGVETAQLRQHFATLTITTYTTAQNIDALAHTKWDILVLDEAQAIKNPAIKQSKAIKKMQATTKIALTGTPVENNLTNLWSIFDFINPGLLGSLKEFKTYVDELESKKDGYEPLRHLIAPFLLRRLKTDKSIIDDLPDKQEIIHYTNLTQRQIVLYKKVISELKEILTSKEYETTQRKGLVLSSIMKLKQICNHPDQFLGTGEFAVSHSGKMQSLVDICETIYEKRERVVVFTQFREMCEPLAQVLSHVFERKGYIIHGGVPAKTRSKIVEIFQGDAYVPFLVVSIKAGGVGLNLTSANHVIHYDRWWNPAVENQATDRVFRIGQVKNVMVYKLVCENTLEEKINNIIEDKKKLAETVIGAGETWLSRLNNDELMSVLSFGKRG
ncbi:MAG: DEAD/DEAH box helicase [Cardiobacteriaceae bacterium]|nr:DEAD/DEAH box helicase [Cardiobacteriaceae bacterium]